MSKVASEQGLNLTDLEQKTLLKEAVVRYARIPHLKDDFDIKPQQSPLVDKRNGSGYYRPKFTECHAFVLQEKYYRRIQELESSLKF